MTKETLSPELVRAVTRFGIRLRSKHAPIGRRAAERLARLLRSVLVPHRKPGRKPTRRVLAAVRMRSEGIPWARIYPALIEGFAALPSYERIYQSRKLRRAVAALVKRAGRRRERRTRGSIGS